MCSIPSAKIFCGFVSTGKAFLWTTSSGLGNLPFVLLKGAGGGGGGGGDEALSLGGNGGPVGDVNGAVGVSF